MINFKKIIFSFVLITFVLIPHFSIAQQTNFGYQSDGVTPCTDVDVANGVICGYSAATDNNGIDINTGGAQPNPNTATSSTTSSPNSNGGLVPPCTVNLVTKECTWGFNEFMKLIDKVIKFILFDMVVPIAAIMFAYAGFLMVTSGGSVEQWGKAKKIFGNVALGLIIAVAAWLIIRTILLIVGYKGAWIGF